MWNPHLNGKNAAEASNMLCASLLRYSYPVLKWTQSDKITILHSIVNITNVEFMSIINTLHHTLIGEEQLNSCVKAMM